MSPRGEICNHLLINRFLLHMIYSYEIDILTPWISFKHIEPTNRNILPLNNLVKPLKMCSSQ